MLRFLFGTNRLYRRAAAFHSLKRDVRGQVSMRGFCDNGAGSGGSTSTVEKSATALAQGEELLERVIKLRMVDDVHQSSSISAWHKHEGDYVKTSEPVLEIDTPEFSFDFQSPDSGIIAKRMKDVGAEIETGAILAYLAKTEEDAVAVREFIDSPEYKEMERIKKEKRREELEEKEKREHQTERDNRKIEFKEYLENLEVDMSEYADALVEEGFDSLKALKTITNEDLKELGVKKGHRRIILAEVESLKQEHQ